MTARVWNAVLDGGLTVLDTTAVSVFIIKQQGLTTGSTTLTALEVTTYAQAISTDYTLGFKTVAAGALFGAIAASSINGRTVTSVSITDGTVTSTGIGLGWAVVSGSSLLATGLLNAATTFSSTANQFVLPGFEITLPAST